MKYIVLAIIGLVNIGPLEAGSKIPQLDYDFNQERMIVEGGDIFLVSSFQDQDGLSAYDFNGHRQWEVRFHAKIISWNVQPDSVLIFSKGRDGDKTYLTCLDRLTGRRLWEKP